MIMSSEELDLRAKRVREIVDHIVYRRKNRVGHTEHSLHRLEAALSSFLDRPVKIEERSADR